MPLSDIRKLGRPAILKTASARGVKLFTHAREAMHFIIQFVPFEHEGTRDRQALLGAMIAWAAWNAGRRPFVEFGLPGNPENRYNLR